MNSKHQENEIARIKSDLDKAKEMRYKAEARLEQLQQQYEEILKELSNMNIRPEDLEKEIEKIENEIEGMLGKIKQNLPANLKE